MFVELISSELVRTCLRRLAFSFTSGEAVQRCYQLVVTTIGGTRLEACLSCVRTVLVSGKVVYHSLALDSSPRE